MVGLSREKQKNCANGHVFSSIAAHKSAPASDIVFHGLLAVKSALYRYTHIQRESSLQKAMCVCVCVKHHFAGMGPQGRAFQFRLLGRIWVVRRNEESSGNDR